MKCVMAYKRRLSVNYVIFTTQFRGVGILKLQPRKCHLRRFKYLILKIFAINFAINFAHCFHKCE